MLRAIFFIVVVIFSTIIAAIPVILVGIFNPYTKFSRTIARGWSRLLLWAAGVKVEIQGLEKVDPGKSYVVICNHQSHMDPPTVFAFLPLFLTVISKKELFKVPVFGQALRATGILKVDRSDREQAIATLQKAEEILRSKHLSLLAFPEGTRSRDGKIHHFKKGPFILAINTGLPVLPLSISGTFPILPKGSIRVNPGRVKLVVHSPVDTRNYSFEKRQDLIEKVREIIKSGFQENYH